MTATAAMLLAAALLTDAGPSTVRARIGIAGRARRVSRKTLHRNDPLAVASSLDVLAVCLAAGMAVSTAAAATAQSAPPLLARVLRRAADLLALGADPVVAWNAPPGSSLDPQTDALLRLARRSSVSGVALADAVSMLATQCRQDAAHAAAAAAERAGVLIAGPLGLCFLPAFVCLGIIPVVAGLAGDVLQSGMW
jgi:pilus assembly protein TadC